MLFLLLAKKFKAGRQVLFIISGQNEFFWKFQLRVKFPEITFRFYYESVPFDFLER